MNPSGLESPVPPPGLGRSRARYVRVLVSSRQPRDDGGVDTDLAVYLMCSDTQMAADTTQSECDSDV